VVKINRIIIYLGLTISFCALIVFSSCNKNNFTTNPADKLEFSTDTVQFDTIFTNIGSATNYFVVRNSNQSQAIKIDRIFVAGESNSKYRLNINGFSTNNITDLELPPGDSIFIFVEVTIDPNRDEMIEEDSVVFLSNGNVQNVKLVAFGQDVHLYFPTDTLEITGYKLPYSVIDDNTVWTNDKPHLVYGTVIVDSDAELRVEAGAKVYFHRGAGLFIGGTLNVAGEVSNRVLFTSDRLEDYYSEIAGQWGPFLDAGNGNTLGIFGGIRLLPGSTNNQIYNCDIKNAIIGLEVDSCVTPGIPTVKLKNTNIENSKIIGLYALGAHIEAENCVFANSGQYNLAIFIGGKYSFIHCTMANYWIGNRQTPQLVLNNYYTYDIGAGTQVSYRDLTDAYFGNCIIYGSREDELVLDLAEGALANFRFDNCLIKSKEFEGVTGSDFFIDNIWNENPKFLETSSPFDYHLDTLSPAKDVGKVSIGNLVPNDQDGNSRLSDIKPDLGAFERQE
jgi:hypothetical protein